ncbi:Hypothetical predicted protein, partial [Mytilus galloprovincialis]
MNDNRISSFGHPKDSSDTVTKRWVTQQMKDGIKDINDLDAALEAISKKLEAIKKSLNGLDKDVAKCLPMAGCKMSGALNRQGHSIVNLPAGWWHMNR